MPTEALTVLAVEPGGARTRVVFKRLAAYYWFAAGRENVQAALERSRISKQPVRVTWDAMTLEIIDVEG